MKLYTVVGMHRSGTSLVTRVANLVGLDLGPADELIPPAADNPEGFWEAEPIKAINDAVLARLGGSWLGPPPWMEEGWENSSGLDDLRRRGTETIDRLFGDAGDIAGWKDPRTSLVLPFWMSVTPLAGSILALRDPREVASSLRRRNGTSPDAAIRLWLRYTAAAWLESERCLVVRYQDVIADPESEARRLAAYLGLPEPSDDALERVEGATRSELRQSGPLDEIDGKDLRAAQAVFNLAISDSATARAILETHSEKWRLTAGVRRSLAQLEHDSQTGVSEVILQATRSEALEIASRLEATSIQLREQRESLESVRRELRGSVQQVEALKKSRNDWKEKAEGLRQQNEEVSERLKNQHRVAREEQEKLRSSLAESARRNEVLTDRLERATAKATQLEANAEEQSAFFTARIERLKADFELDRQSFLARVERAEERAANQRRNLDRLRGRRVVRVSLAVASFARPLFRVVRAFRKRISMFGTRGSGSAVLSTEMNRAEMTDARPSPSAVEHAAMGEAEGPQAEPQERLTGDRQILDQLERIRSKPQTTVMIPVYNAVGELEGAVENVLRHTPTEVPLLLIDDASPDPAVGKYLARLESNPRIRVLRNEGNQGFVKTVNRGFRETEGDVVVLNSDTLVPPRWLSNLTLAAYSAERVATATPLSNNAGAFSVPDPGSNELPGSLTTEEVGRLIMQESRRVLPSTPTAHGFCMYVRRDMLEDVGLFDEQAFHRGYGEENDLSMRAGGRGWRHVVDDATLVYHKQAASFGTERDERIKAARRVIDERYPEYTAAVRAFMRGDDITGVRERVRSQFESVDDDPPRRPRLLFVIHEGSGGTPLTNADLMKALSDEWEVFILTSDRRHLRFAALRGGRLVEIHSHRLAQNLDVTSLSVEEYISVVASWLIDYAIEIVHIRHLFKHTLDIPRICRLLSIPVVLSFHDYYYICPTVHLLDHRNRYCGGKCTPGDGVCAAPNGGSPLPHLKHNWVLTWRDHAREAFDAVDAFVTTTTSARSVYTSVFRELSEIPIQVIEHGRDLKQVSDVRADPIPGGPIRLVVLGSLGVHKGAHFLQELRRRDEEGRLEIHLLGSVPPEYAHLGRVHGPYDRDDVHRRLRSIRPHFVGLFSIWPETYCHTLTEAWSASVPVVASHLGALGERVRQHGGGWVVDIDDPEGAYQTIVSAADDPQEYERAARRATAQDLPSTRDMAMQYSSLYTSLIDQRIERLKDETHLSTRSIPHMDVFVVGGIGSHPASVHVRSLRRLRHPELRDSVVARTRDLESFLEDGPYPDAAWVQRTAIPPSMVEKFLSRLEERDIPLAVDLDDNLLEVDHTIDAEYGEYVPYMRRLTTAASIVTVSTPTLAEIVNQYSDHTLLLPNNLDETIWFDDEDAVGPAALDGAKLRLLYMGTTTHAEDLSLLRPAIEELRDALEMDVDLVVVGGEPKSASGAWYSRLTPPPGHSAYPLFVRWLRSVASGFHIAVAPLAESRFNSFKSDLKYLEYSAMRLPAVFSDYGPYARSVEDGVTGVLTSNDSSSWVEAIGHLVADWGDALRIADSAYENARTNRTIGSNLVDTERVIDLLRIGL